MKLVVIGLFACVLLPGQTGRTGFVEVGPMRHGAPILVSPLVAWSSNNQGHVWRTTDGGVTWAELTTPALAGSTGYEMRGFESRSASEAWLWLAPRDALGSSNIQTVFRTSDGGRTWVEQTPLPTAEWYQESFFSLRNGEAIWMGGMKERVERSPRGGPDACVARPGNPQFDPVIYYRPKRGAAWVEQPLPIRNGCPVQILHFFDGRRGLAVVQNSILRTDDGGRHWLEAPIERVPVANRAGAGWVAPPINLHFLDGNDQIGWIGYENGEILKTTDGGQHWQQLVRKDEIWSRIVGFGHWGWVYFATESIGWTLGGQGTLFETRDGGTTWQKLKAPVRITYATCAQGHCWVEGQDVLFKLIWR
ncbi:hypothetical protein [Paludibaculum fermentans]|uniref:hypothetical protein n=1 Tax=Paludibaculum fermentans TaxID=1473598 RepID=UPI003EBDDC38